MPANMQTENQTRAQIAANPNASSVFGKLILRVVSTAQGWITRQALKLASVASACVTTWLASKFVLIEQVASKAGASQDTLSSLHEAGASLVGVLGALTVTFIIGTTEAILSRMAAKVAEQPVIPKALPVEPEPKTKKP